MCCLSHLKIADGSAAPVNFIDPSGQRLKRAFKKRKSDFSDLQYIRDNRQEGDILKKILRITAKCIAALLILAAAFMAFLLLNWQNRYIFSHYDENLNVFITIMGEEYYFDPKLIQHSEREFRNLSAGITYEELVKKFGYENGQLNSNAIKNGIYYALAEDRFVVFSLANIYTSENGETTRTLTVWRIALCDDKEELELLSEDREIYDESSDTWEMHRFDVKDTVNQAAVRRTSFLF